MPRILVSCNFGPSARARFCSGEDFLLQPSRPSYINPGLEASRAIPGLPFLQTCSSKALKSKKRNRETRKYYSVPTLVASVPALPEKKKGGQTRFCARNRQDEETEREGERERERVKTKKRAGKKNSTWVLHWDGLLGRSSPRQPCPSLLLLYSEQEPYHHLF